MSGFHHDHPGYQRGQKMEREGKIEPHCGGYRCFEDGNLFGDLTLGSMTSTCSNTQVSLHTCQTIGTASDSGNSAKSLT